MIEGKTVRTFLSALSALSALGAACMIHIDSELTRAGNTAPAFVSAFLPLLQAEELKLPPSRYREVQQHA